MRILANIFLFFSIVYFPWWAWLPVALFFIFMFESFYEAVFWALVSDFLYGTGSVSWEGFGFYLTLIVLAVFLGIQWFKQYIRV